MKIKVKVVKWIMAIVVIFTVFVLNSTSKATTYEVYGTKLTVYSQSTAESEANLARSSKGIYNGGEHPWCGNRFYIDFSDKDLFDRALLAEITGEAVNIMYEDDAPERFINGHIQFGCKLLSIWK